MSKRSINNKIKGEETLFEEDEHDFSELEDDDFDLELDQKLYHKS